MSKKQKKNSNQKYAVTSAKEGGMYFAAFENGRPMWSSFPVPLSKLEADYVVATVPNVKMIPSRHKMSEEDKLLSAIFRDGTLLEQEARKYFENQQAERQRAALAAAYERGDRVVVFFGSHDVTNVGTAPDMVVAEEEVEKFRVEGLEATAYPINAEGFILTNSCPACACPDCGGSRG